MKLLLNIPVLSKRRGVKGFTLVETMISAWIFLIIFVGVMIALQIFGLRVYTLGATKLSATAGAVKVLGQIRDDIRGAYTVDVGTCSSGPSSFVGTNQNVGNALRIFTTTNSIPYMVYYLDGGSNLNMSTTADGVSFSTAKLASYITNQMVFDAEDFQGNILSNNINNRIIRMELDFYQWEYPIGFVGGAGLNAYDYYRLTTKITVRHID